MGCGEDDRQPERLGAIGANQSSQGTAKPGAGAVRRSGRNEQRRRDDSKTPPGFTRVDDLDQASVQKAVKEMNRELKRFARRNRGKRRISRIEIERLSEQAVRTLASTALTLLGFDKATLNVSRGGRQVIVLIHPSQACTARRSDERLIVRRIRLATRFAVRRVRVLVGNSRLGAYLRRHCTGRSPGTGELVDEGKPGTGKRRTGGRGTGKTVYSGTNAGTGKGIIYSPEFEISAKRWTIEYENFGSDFKIVVFEDNAMGGLVVNEGERTAGRTRVNGPGTFRLMIGGTGIWTVRVRDGA